MACRMSTGVQGSQLRVQRLEGFADIPDRILSRCTIQVTSLVPHFSGEYEPSDRRNVFFFALLQ